MIFFFWNRGSKENFREVYTRLSACFIDNLDIYDFNLVLMKSTELYHWGESCSKNVSIWPAGYKKSWLRIHVEPPGPKVFHAYILGSRFKREIVSFIAQ